jgi:hypothetical protein
MLLGCLPLEGRRAAEAFLQPGKVQRQRIGYRVHAVLAGQLHRSLAERTVTFPQACMKCSVDNC